MNKNSTEQNFRCRSVNFIASLWLGLAGLLLLGNAHSQAQTLDQALVNALSGGCTGISDGEIIDGEIIIPTLIGENLARFCAFPFGNEASTGGGSGATQSDAVGFERVSDRLEKKRRGEKEGDRGTTAEAELGRSGLNLFISFDGERREKDVTTFEDGFKSDVFGVSFGVDYAIDKNLITGLALNYNREGSDFDSGGGFDYDTYGVVAFLSVLPADSVFIEILGGYSRRDYSTSRSVTFSDDGGPSQSLFGLTSGDTHGDIYSATATVGYGHNFGRYAVGLSGGFSYSHTKIDRFSEQGSTGLELIYGDQKVTSLRSSVKVQASAPTSAGFGVIVPQIGIEYVHEFRDDQRSITVNLAEDLSPTRTDIVFQEEAPDRDFFNLTAGVSVVLPRGIQAFVNFRTLYGHEYLGSYGGTIGVRIEL